MPARTKRQECWLASVRTILLIAMAVLALNWAADEQQVANRRVLYALASILLFVAVWGIYQAWRIIKYGADHRYR